MNKITEGTKSTYSAPQFERYGNVRDLTQHNGVDRGVGNDSGFNSKNSQNFVRTH